MDASAEKDFWERAVEIVRANRKRIGIGIKTATPKIAASLNRAREYVDVVVVGERMAGFECVASDSIDPLIEMARDGQIDGVVRGNFDALDGYNAVKKALGHTGSILEMNVFKLNGIKTIDEDARGIFCVLPVSFVNERTVEDKIRSIELHLQFFRRIGLTPRIGILGPGKPSDRRENIAEVNAGLEEAEGLVEFCTQKGLWAKYFNHQIENAVREANIIVAQNSWGGNVAAHCLLYLGSCDYLGGAALNIERIVYVDDGEAMQDFTNCLIFAGYLAHMRS